MREDWIECKLRDLVQYSKGKKPSNLVNEKIDNDYKPYINIKAFEKGIIEEYSNDVKANYCVDGDLLMVWDGARAGLVGKAKNGLIGSTLMKIEPKKDVHKELIFYYLKSLFATINTNTKGVGIPHVEPNLLWDSHLLFFPLPEQRAIVKKLESLFSSLDAGVADLKKAQQQLKIYRQAVLKKAFEGEFETVRIGDVLNLSREKHKPDKPESLFYIGLEHIEKHTGRLTEKVGYEEINTVKNKFKKNDILYGKLRPNLNKVYLANESGVCSTDMLVFTPSEKVVPKFVMQIMLSRGFVNDMSNNTSGVNLPRVSTKYVENYLIPLPNIDEQREIVKQIESRLSVCDSIEQDIKESLIKAEALRQSILKKAFEGNLLTAQELAECKQAADYEPANVLLERIKAEQKSPTDNTDKRRKKAIKLR